MEPSTGSQDPPAPQHLPDRGWPIIEVAGFKSIRDPLQIALAPLTVLAGQNSSGKTSVMQPLLLVKQTLEVAYDPGPLLIDGSNASFSNAKEMVWRGAGGAPNADSAHLFRFRHVDFDGESTQLVFEATAHGMDLRRVEYDSGELVSDRQSYSLFPGMTTEQMRATGQKSLLELIERSERDGVNWEFSLDRSRCFFDVNVARSGEPRSVASQISLTRFTTLQSLASRLIHLPGLRGTPARFYPTTQVGSVFPGAFPPYVASIISSWMENKDERLRVLGRQLSALGLTWRVDAKRVDDTRVALRVGRLPRGRRGGHDMVNIADVGLGVSQTLPILVALLSAARGQLVYLEQPEIHLHPRAQVALADILLDAALRDVRVVTETHSYLLIKAIQTAVARRGLGDEVVNLHWFTRDADGASRQVQAVMDAEGRVGEWPSDFAQIELEVEEKYLSSVLGI